MLLAATSVPSYSVRLDAMGCAAMPLRNAAALGAGWATMARYVQRCAIRAPGGHVGLLVDIVRMDRAMHDGFAGSHTYAAAPLPVLRTADGRILGHLPEGFPIDPPGQLKVRFTRWQGDLPREIVLYQAGESALAPYSLPSLRWDVRSRSYR